MALAVEKLRVVGREHVVPVHVPINAVVPDEALLFQLVHWQLAALARSGRGGFGRLRGLGGLRRALGGTGVAAAGTVRAVVVGVAVG